MNNGSSFKDVGAFIKLNSFIGVLFKDIRFLDDGNGFAGQSALVDKGRPFKDNGLKRKFYRVLEEYNVSGNDINR